jgi:RNA polymerase sigma factor (sigma-70 family)
VESTDSAQFAAAVRRGDLPAATELLRRYEPALRAVIRQSLGDGRLRRVFDTSDIWQSVFGDFLSRLAVSPNPADLADHLLAYLTSMVRNKIITKARREALAPEPLPEDYDHAAAGPPPPDQVADRLLIQEIRNRLPPAERDLLDQLAQGRTWPEIAAESGYTPDALRMRLRRAVAAAKAQLGDAEGCYGR